MQSLLFFFKSSMVIVHFLLVFFANSALFLGRGGQDQNAVHSVCICAVGGGGMGVGRGGSSLAGLWQLNQQRLDCEARMPGDHPQKTGMPWFVESANSARHHQWSASFAP